MVAIIFDWAINQETECRIVRQASVGVKAVPKDSQLNYRALYLLYAS